VATPVSESASVAIVDFAFEPQELAVAMGTSVVWTNTGAAPHTVTGDWAASEVLPPGEIFSHTFAAEGRFAYVCAIHPEMTGTVIVGPAGAAPDEVSTAGAADPSGVWRVDLASADPAGEETGVIAGEFVPFPT
jgi:hypothetical protein